MFVSMHRLDMCRLDSAEYNGYLELAIKDDGVGFQLSNDLRRFGLQTMAEKADIAGGSLTVTSVPGEGTAVKLQLPLL